MMMEIRGRRQNDPSRTRVIYMGAHESESGIAVAKALGSPQRLRILDYLQTRVANVSDIAQALEMPLSTANLHLNVLEESGLIRSETIAASRGVQKICSRAYDMIVIQLPRSPVAHEKQVSVEMPIGAFVDFQVSPTCGLATEEGIVGYFDDPVSFYEPQRYGAHLLWFRQGYLEYRFPYRSEPERAPKSLVISMEICSEAPNHHPDWPSDIFMEVNGQPIGTWTSPGDFGGERGNLTPDWWEEWNSQYGLLKSWRINEEGSWIDGMRLSDVKIEDLQLDAHPFIKVRLGVRSDTPHVGGLNLFGRKFGNYPQDIVLQLHY